MNQRTCLRLLIISTVACFGLSSSQAENAAFHPGTLNADAPPETKQFGQLVGVWEAEQTVREGDGTWSQKKTHSEWRWYYILNGHAIQDDWWSRQEEEALQPVGTNIRIYNPQEKKWHMAWIDKNNRALGTFTAVSENGNVVMTGLNAKGRLIRNTFSNISDQAFDWVQEWTQDDGKTWFAVARIHCSRKQ